MVDKVEWNRTTSIRGEIHNLDLKDPDDLKIYEIRRNEFITMNEGSFREACDDTKGLRTVGIGFNIQSDGARKECDETFNGHKNKPDFDKVFSRGKKLNNAQINSLLDSSIDIREKQFFWSTIFFR